jgi:preprotein translocase subunit SecG
MKLILTFIHVGVCLALILIVLLQRGKGASMGAAFGGSSQTMFGSAGASSFLSKITAAAAIVFMLTSLGLAFLFGQGASSSIMGGASPAPVTETQPAGEPSQAAPDSGN